MIAERIRINKGLATDDTEGGVEEEEEWIEDGSTHQPNPESSREHIEAMYSDLTRMNIPNDDGYIDMEETMSTHTISMCTTIKIRQPTLECLTQEVGSKIPEIGEEDA